jgi:hypothetical protein
VAELLDQQATLSQGVETLLHRVRSFQRCRVTVTGIAGEFTTIPFKVKRRVIVPGAGGFFEAREVSISVVQTLLTVAILATAPAGVGSLDIVYDVRTGADA